MANLMFWAGRTRFYRTVLEFFLLHAAWWPGVGLGILALFFIFLVPLWVHLVLRPLMIKYSRELGLSYVVVTPVRWLRLLGYASFWHFLALVLGFTLVFYHLVAWFNLHLGQRLFCLIQDGLDYFNPFLARQGSQRVLRWWAFRSASFLLLWVALNVSIRLVHLAQRPFPFLEGWPVWQELVGLRQEILGLLLFFALLNRLASLVFNPFTYFASGFEAVWHGYYCAHVSDACRSGAVPWFPSSEIRAVEFCEAPAPGLVLRLYARWHALLLPRQTNPLVSWPSRTLQPVFDPNLFLHFRAVGRHYRTAVFDGRDRDLLPRRFLVR